MNTAEQFRAFLAALGLDEVADPELVETPERYTEMLKELFAGLHEEPPEISTFPPPKSDAVHGPVVICATPFQSMCVHHLLPFFGTVDVAYQPDKQMVGFGSIGRIIDHFARRPQVQERMIAEITDYIQKTLNPRGLLVRLRARQLCMEMRGAKKTGELISLASRGSLQEGEQRGQLLTQFQSAERAL